MKEVNLEEVQKLLLKVSTKKSSDVFGISPKLIKLLAEFIKGHLNLICANCSIISIFPILSKILQKLLHKRLINYLDKYELLFKHQHGFQKGNSEETYHITFLQNLNYFPRMILLIAKFFLKILNIMV